MAPQPRYWWVNHDRYYGVERSGGFLWAPKDGRHDHRRIADIQVHDAILHNVEDSLRAVSRVSAAADLSAPFSDECVGVLVNHALAQSRPGYFLLTIFIDLPRPIPISEITGLCAAEGRRNRYGPFDPSGSRRGRSGYLYRVSREFGHSFSQRFLHPRPPAPAQITSQNALSRQPFHSDAVTAPESGTRPARAETALPHPTVVAAFDPRLAVVQARVRRQSFEAHARDYATKYLAVLDGSMEALISKMVRAMEKVAADELSDASR